MTPTPVDTRAQAARAQRDGCGCHEWVIRCVHWGELVIWLLDKTQYVSAHGEYGGHGFRVVTGTPYREPSCSLGYQRDAIHGEGDDLYTDSLPAAEVEFARRERELLGRSDG